MNNSAVPLVSLSCGARHNRPHVPPQQRDTRCGLPQMKEIPTFYFEAHDVLPYSLPSLCLCLKHDRCTNSFSPLSGTSSSSNRHCFPLTLRLNDVDRQSGTWRHMVTFFWLKKCLPTMRFTKKAGRSSCYPIQPRSALLHVLPPQ